MSKLIDYFNLDFKGAMVTSTVTVTLSGDNVAIPLEVKVKLNAWHEPNSSTRLCTFYIPECEFTYSVCKGIINDLPKLIKENSLVDTISFHQVDQNIGVHSTVYSHRVYFYCETPLELVELKELAKQCDEKGIFVTIRSQDYVNHMNNSQKPLAFISHDSRDKELIARPLALGLKSRFCTVWYDEFSLEVGDSLRQSIEKGIKESTKCILVLSPHFLSNPGWGKKEFDSIFTREMITESRVILPIWYKVSKQEVHEYSPSLADTFALSWPDPSKMSPEQYNSEVELLISKLHTTLSKSKNIY